MLAAGAAALPALGLGIAHARQEAAAKVASEDPMLAAELLIGGMEQIEKSRFALGRTQNADVKQFAQAEIDEHETVKRKLQGLGYAYPAAAGAAAAGATPGGAANSATSSPAPAQGVAAGADAAHGHAHGAAVSVGRASIPAPAANMVMVCDEVARHCVATAKSELGQLQGIKLDKRYIGDQLSAHYGLFSKVTTFQKHASQEMQPVLAEGLKIIQTHIASLKGIMDKLDAQQTAQG
jgi:predicted outer membrane protein